MNRKIFIQIEEYLNNISLEKNCVSAAKLDPNIIKAIEQRQNENEETLYEFVCRHLRKRNFVKKSGLLDEAGFYKYADIDRSTWSNLRYGEIPTKTTLLKLIIGLRLNEEDAKTLMEKGSNALNILDKRDQVILGLIDARCYVIEDVYDVLEEFGENGKVFKNIYSFR